MTIAVAHTDELYKQKVFAMCMEFTILPGVELLWDTTLTFVGRQYLTSQSDDADSFRFQSETIFIIWMTDWQT